MKKSPVSSDVIKKFLNTIFSLFVGTSNCLLLSTNEKSEYVGLWFVFRRYWFVILRSPEVVAVSKEVTPDLSALTVSPMLNVFWFNRTIPSVVTFGFSTTTATALLSNPVIFSPTIKSELFPLGPEYAVRVNDGKSASPESFDSNTANNWTASGTFNEILRSWTLVPNTLLNVKPSFKVLVPIPDAAKVERLILITFASFNFLSLFLTLLFNTVANKFAFPVALLNATNVTVFLSAEISTWLSFNGSIDPSSYDIKYLSSSKGWKNKSAPALGEVNWLPATVISLNCFLSWTVVVVTSKLSILLCLTGVKRLFWSRSKLALRSKRSFTSSEPAINPSKTPPPQTPVTDAIPATFIWDPSVDTPVILLNLGTVSPGTL